MTEEGSTDLVVATYAGTLVTATGEIVEATAENAYAILSAAATFSDQLAVVRRGAEAFLTEESKRLGTKTIHTGAGTVSVSSGGSSVEYDHVELEALLRDAGCPEQRIREVVKEEISYKVDRSVLRQLTASNPDYAAAAELASREVEKPLRWSAK